MLEINDYSNRRGVIVPMLPKIHAMLVENATRDKLASLEPPEHLIVWSQKMRKVLTDVSRRFFVAQDGGFLAGIFFYRYEGEKIFIEDVQIAWAFRNNPGVIDGFLQRFDYDQGTKDATFFASERIKSEADKEMLASKGFKKELEDGWERLGTYSQAVAAIKLRYNRSVSI
ncbi:MAG: hypothetical protein FWF80_06870 [Defluviitaleaceae bacterium]|nr:hypothetical protein [Defluviitaleaceae bacterium]